MMKDIGGFDVLYGSLLKIVCLEGFVIDFLFGVFVSFKVCYLGVDFIVWVVLLVDVMWCVCDGDVDIVLIFSFVLEKGVCVDYMECVFVFVLVWYDYLFVVCDVVLFVDVVCYVYVLFEVGMMVC